MSEWYVYDWELQGLPARFHVDFRYVEEFDSLGDFTTLLYVSCYAKKPDVLFRAGTARAGRRKQRVPQDSRRKVRVRRLDRHCGAAQVLFLHFGCASARAADGVLHGRGRAQA